MKDEYLKVNVDIHNLNEVPSLIYDVLKEWWDTSYLSDLNSEDNIPAII